MEDRICPACKTENDADAAYCDQCGQHLTVAEKTDDAEQAGCPACGGIVQDRGDGNGVCGECGLELAETPTELAPDGVVEKLTAAVLRRANAGIPIQQAVVEACQEIYAPHSEETASAVTATETAHPCPLCGAECPESAARCGGCGLWFHQPRAAESCPRCERPASPSGKCDCGAVLTLPKLLKYIEPSVRFICKQCKQPYTILHPKCPDCDGGLISAERIKAYAKS